jgi:hypothetical protein
MMAILGACAMARKTTGSRYRLGEPLSSELAAFCEALLGTLEIRVIREALRTYMDQRLAAEPELRRRYEIARKRQVGSVEGDNVIVMPKGK